MLRGVAPAREQGAAAASLTIIRPWRGWGWCRTPIPTLGASSSHIADVLTRRPDIVIALPPKRSHPKAKVADMPKVPVIVEARDPRRIRRGKAADRLFAEIVRAVATRARRQS